ncbi:hypothetical protein QL285_034212 [Trifolium repens]|nr:hypothetical protein QL285_034212 [Trifolium repens]
MRVLVCFHSSFLFSDGNATDAAVSYLLNFVSLSAIVLLCFGPLSVQFCHPNVAHHKEVVVLFWTFGFVDNIYAGNILLSSFMFSVMKISVTDAYENPTISGNLNCGSKGLLGNMRMVLAWRAILRRSS